MKLLLRCVAVLYLVSLLSAPFLGLCATAQAADQLLQLSDDGGAGCGSFDPAPSVDGGKVAFESDCDLDPAPGGLGNADGSREIFLFSFAGGIQQLTSGAGCSSTNPAVDDSASRVVFESDCDLDPAPAGPGNADGGVELFLYEATSGLVSQLTSALDCAALSPSISGDGKLVVFDSDCNYTGLNSSGKRNSEIFLLDTDSAPPPPDPAAFAQLTLVDSQLCDSTSPSISRDGAFVAFDSDCDLLGSNEDFAIEIFRLDLGAAPPPPDPASMTQLTLLGDDTCSSVLPSISGDGARVAFESDCDFTGANTDNSEEIFVADGEGPVIQVSDDDGSSLCESVEPAINDGGSQVVYSGYCDPLGANPDQSFEVFRARVGGAISQVTDGFNCSSFGAAVETGVGRVIFASDCDPLGSNADGAPEIFSSLACDCGAPVTRFQNSDRPLATDALFTLQAAVGSESCSLCECDVDNNGFIVASDALTVLNVAVGTPGVVLDCPAP